MIILVALLLPAAAGAGSPQNSQRQGKLPRPRILGRGMELRRDPATGELRNLRAEHARPHPAADSPAATIRSRVNLVEVGCNLVSPDGAPVLGLGREDFRLFEDGAEQTIVHFDASGNPASIALVFDISPSIFRELEGMKAAARALARDLAPRDEVAVVAFAAQAHLLLPFTRDRAQLEQATASPEMARVANSTESNIYRAVYLTAGELFPGRTGRKAIVLLTDGQDSGLGLTWEPASAAPPVAGSAQQSSERLNRLTFEDVARALAAAGIEMYVISTENRPRAMTEAWLATHQRELLVTPAARELGMPLYTLYLAELVRRVGGRLYFLREIGTLDEVYRRIAATLSEQYTLGYYPAAGIVAGWRPLRIELTRPRDVRLTHRPAYYMPAER